MKINDSKINLIYYRHNKNKKAMAINSAQINYCDLTIVLENELNYIINGKDIALKSGNVLFLPNGSTRYREASKTNVDYVSFNFLTDTEIKLPMFINSGVNNEIRMLIKVCDEIKNHYYDEDVEKVLTPILKSLLLLIEIKLIKASTNPIVLKIQRYIQQNISSKISLTDIARVISYSPSYCDIIFKNETGKSIINYSIDLKINEAKQLLIEGVYSLKKIADSLGFSDYNYFSRLFKKRTGYTPSEYALNNF